MRHGATGAVLAIAALMGIVLMVLATAVYVAFRSNVESFRHVENRIRAEMAAEAGVSLALRTLALADSMPVGPEPFSLPGDSAQWISLPSGDRVWVVIDPSDLNYLPNTVGGVEIRSRGMARGMIRDVAVTASADFPSSYSLLACVSIPGTFLRDGTVLAGPVHCNGRIEFSSETADSADDPWVARISTTAGGGFFFVDAGRCDVPHPPGSRVWVRPYPRMQQGRPYWDASADSIDFGRVREWFSGLVPEAVGQGTLVRNARRILLDGDRMIIGFSTMDPPDTLSLSGKDLVFLDSGFGPVYMKSIRPVIGPLTIVSRGPIYVMGSISAGSASAGTPLALVSLDDIVIAADPGLYGGEDWPMPWDVQTDRPVVISAFLVCPGGSFSVENPMLAGQDYPLNVLGGVMESRFGPTGTTTTGYTLAIAWDEGYQRCHPPHFPTLELWKMSSWQLSPDYDGAAIDDNQF
jgi:hypothetical protein